MEEKAPAAKADAADVDEEVVIVEPGDGGTKLYCPSLPASLPSTCPPLPTLPQSLIRKSVCPDLEPD